VKKPNSFRIGIISLYFLISVFVQPNWVSDNFWYKADFWDALPFNFPYMGFILIYAAISTLLFDQFIRLVKKYA
jgi:hypothetical protein